VSAAIRAPDLFNIGVTICFQFLGAEMELPSTIPLFCWQFKSGMFLSHRVLRNLQLSRGPRAETNAGGASACCTNVQWTAGSSGLADSLQNLNYTESQSGGGWKGPLWIIFSL